VGIIEVTWLLEKAWIIIFFIFGIYIRSIKEDNSKRDLDIANINLFMARAELEYITDIKLQNAITQNLAPYKEDQQELKLLLKGLNENITSLSKDVAVQYAIGNLSHENR
jgi:hypothetical protein